MTDYARVVSFIFDLFSHEFATQLFFVCLLMTFAFKKRNLFWLRYLLGWGALVGVMWLFRCFVPVPAVLIYLIVLSLLFGIVMLSFKVNFLQALFFVVTAHCIQNLISNVAYMLIYVVMLGTGKNEDYVYYYVEMPIVFAVGLVIEFFTVVRSLRNHEELAFNNIVVLYCSVAFLGVAIFLTHYARNAMWFLLDGLVYMLAIASLFVMATLIIEFMNLSYKKLQKENAVIVGMLRKDKQRYEQAKLSNEKIMIKYHDILKRMHGGIVDYEEMEECESDREIVHSTYFTGNTALDVVLSEKALMCERLGIRLICTADGEAMSFMKPHHIYSLIGNALENAIESVRREDEPSNKEITFNLMKREFMCVCSVSNYTSRVIEFRDGLPVTNKPNAEEHGFGTRSMKNVVKKYDGQIGFYQDGDIFTVTVTIPIVGSAERKKP